MQTQKVGTVSHNCLETPPKEAVIVEFYTLIVHFAEKSQSDSFGRPSLFVTFGSKKSSQSPLTPKPLHQRKLLLSHSLIKMNTSKLFDQAVGSPIVVNSTITCVNEASTSVVNDDSTAVLGRQNVYTCKVTVEATPVKASARIQDRQHGNKNNKRLSSTTLDDLSSMFGGLAVTANTTIRSTPFKNVVKPSPKKKQKLSARQVTTSEALKESIDLGHVWQEVDGTRIRKSLRLARVY